MNVRGLPEMFVDLRQNIEDAKELSDDEAVIFLRDALNVTVNILEEVGTEMIVRTNRLDDANKHLGQAKIEIEFFRWLWEQIPPALQVGITFAYKFKDEQAREA